MTAPRDTPVRDEPQTKALPIPSDLAIQWGFCGECCHSPGNHGGTLVRTPGKPCYVRDCTCPGYAALAHPEEEQRP